MSKSLMVKRDPQTAIALEKALLIKRNQAASQFAARFFKCGKGEYGEGDHFLGINVPETRRTAKRFNALPLEEVGNALQSPWHEVRLAALVILTKQAELADREAMAKYASFYLSQSKRINNWDLVDASADKIVGRWLWQSPADKKVLATLSRSTCLWDRRIAMLATFWFTKQGDVRPALETAKRLLDDQEDLMHKAVGWMLREVGKRNEAALVAFLERHGKRMPRTALRYAIERFSPTGRKQWLSQTKALVQK